MNMVITSISVAIAVIGFERAKNPPTMETMPIPMPIALTPFERWRAKAPSIILAIPTVINAIPSNVTKISVVTSGLANTAADNAIVIAPSTIWAIRNHVGDFSELKDLLDFLTSLIMIVEKSGYCVIA